MAVYAHKFDQHEIDEFLDEFFIQKNDFNIEN